MNKILDTLTLVFAVSMVMFTGVGTYAFLNVITRPEFITVAVELPTNRKGIVTMWDPVDNEVGLGDSPDWYVDYEANIRYDDGAIENTFYNTQAYSAEDHVCMALNIYFEGRNESLKGQMAIALVTLQRVQDYRYPNTVCGVVFEDKQFSWYSDGLSDRPRNSESYDDIALLASAMLDSETAIYDFTYGSTHYHADYVTPYWVQHMVRKVKIDTHIFYYEPVVHTTASL
jgi:hypothetical protein